MTSARLALSAVALLLCTEASGAAQRGEESRLILPEAAAEAVEQTPCPKVGGVSVEACLLWLTPDVSQPAADAARIARERGTPRDDNDAGAIVISRDGLRGRSKAEN
jgi:hypothetical protein